MTPAEFPSPTAAALRPEPKIGLIALATVVGGIVGSLLGTVLYTVLSLVMDGLIKPTAPDDMAPYFSFTVGFADTYLVSLWTLFFVMPVALLIALPLLLFLREIRPLYMILISTFAGMTLGGAVMLQLFRVTFPLYGASIGFTFGVVIAAFRGVGRPGNFSRAEAETEVTNSV
jgi:hypothetical protein